MNLAAALSQPLPDIETLRSLWIVFDSEYLANFMAAQDGHAVHRAQPIELADGRFAVKADLLSEIGPGGIFSTQFARLDASKFSSVEIMPTSELPPRKDEF